MMFLPNLCFVLRMIPDTADVTINYLEYIFRIFPPFSFGFAFINMPILRWYSYMLSWDKIPEAFDWNGCLKDLIALCITAVLLLLGVFVSELKHKFAFLMKKNKRKKTVGKS